MQTIVALLALVAVASAGVAYAPATYISRAPQYDSAVIKSDRLGGNFAYSVKESHAYAAHTPIVQQVTSPVAVSYSAPAVQSYIAQPQVAYSQQVVQGPVVQQYAASPYAVYNGAGLINGGYAYASPAQLGYSTILHK